MTAADVRVVLTVVRGADQADSPTLRRRQPSMATAHRVLERGCVAASRSPKRLVTGAPRREDQWLGGTRPSTR